MSKIIMDGPVSCSECKASFVAEKIPKGSKEFYGDYTHFSRLVGIYDVNLDRTVYFQCPECPARYGRDYKLITELKGKKQNEKKQRSK